MIVGAIFILSGLVGWLAYDNFIQKTRTDVSNKSTISTKSMEKPNTQTPLAAGRMDPGFAVDVSWHYPQNWSIDKKGSAPKVSSESAGETITLSSPSKAIDVVYNVHQNGGYGGTCGMEGPSKILYIRREPNINFSKSIFVETIVDSYDSLNEKYTFMGYRYRSALMGVNSSAATAAEGESYCKVIGTQGAMPLLNNPQVDLMRAEIILKNIEKKNQYGEVLNIESVESIKRQYDLPEYKEAIKILLSTKVDN